ncbi:MAG TPA: fumarylacetoacetate hydrolase family protein [Acidimicrobiales bacterium]|jgi:2-keto-4-pentenoate hydratase/2-oxohepta-3-ene-1,7-dioic acid hydratase in catechol pathway
MKLATLFVEQDTSALHLALDGGYAAVDDLARAAGNERLQGMRDVADLFARGDGVVEDLRALANDARATVSFDDARLAPPVRRPSKIICVGLNYLAHIEESGGTRPERIVLFSKYPSSLVASGDAVQLPSITNELDYEGELAIVIGRRTKGVSVEDAMGAIGGYTIMNDVSARDLQGAESQWVRGKALDTFAPLGPVVLDARSAPPIGEMRIRTTVNGEERQNALCSLMITPVPDLISYISAFVTLEPGDLIATGTPSGVAIGMDVPKFLEDGDVMVVAIDEIGALTNTVVTA